MLFEGQASHIILAAVLGKIHRLAVVKQGYMGGIANDQCEWWLTFNIPLTTGLAQLREYDLAAAITDFHPRRLVKAELQAVGGHQGYGGNRRRISRW